MLTMGSYLDQLTSENMLARKRSTSSEEGPAGQEQQCYRRQRQHHLHLPPSLECSSDQQIFLPSTLPSVQEKEGPSNITSWQLTSRSPYARPAPIRTDGSVSSSDTLNPSSSRRHDTFAHERRFSDASALLSASSAFTSPNDPFSAGFLSDASYLRSPDQKDFPFTYTKLPASHTQDVYATKRQDEIDTANSPSLSSRARAGSNSSNMPIDLSKLDLKLTLGVEGKPYSYAQLITYAIAHAPGGKLTLSEIYDWCIENFPYFQKQTNAGWKNSVRHNLSLNKTFVKVPRPVHEPGKGAYWALDGQSLMKGPVTTSQSRNRQRSQSAVEPLTRPCQTANVVVAGRPRAGSGVSGSEQSSVRSRYQPSSLSSVLSQDYADSLLYPQSCAIPAMLPYSPIVPSIQATMESQPRGYLQSCYPDFPVGIASVSSQYRDSTIHGSHSPGLSTLSSTRMPACDSLHSNSADFLATHSHMAENTFPDCDTTHHQVAGTMSTPIVLPRGYEPLSHPSQWTLPEQMNIARYYPDSEDDYTMQYD